MVHGYRTFYCANCGAQIIAPVPCGNRFCKVCNRSRRAKITSRLRHIIDHLTFHKGYTIRMITFTVPNQPNLGEMIDHLFASFRRLRQRQVWKAYVKGGIACIQITGGPDQWHAHLHCIVLGRYFPWALLKRNWQKCSTGSGVYISYIPQTAIINYVINYATKSNSTIPVQTLISAELKGRRLYQTFGQFHTIMESYIPITFICRHCGHDHLICLSYRATLFEVDTDTYEPIIRSVNSNRDAVFGPPPHDYITP